MTTARNYRFGEWQLDAQSGDLSGKGQSTRLPEQPLRILLALLERPGEVVGRDELISRLWPQGVVEYEMGLNAAVRKLRLALQDDAEKPRFVETIPRRGYRFVGQLLPEEQPAGMQAQPMEPALPPRSRLPWLVLLAFVVLLAGGAAYFLLEQPSHQPAAEAAPVKLAVLPFRPLVADQPNPALGLGVSGALISRLGVLPGLRIAPLGTVRRYDGPEVDPLQAGKELDVQMVLEGFLQQEEEGLRVTARLLRVNDGQTLWSGQFDESIADIFKVQDAIASRVASAMAPQLSEASPPALWPQETGSTEAFQDFASAQYHQFRRDTNALPLAVEFYERALAHDPGYVDAWAGLSVALAVQAVFGLAPPAEVFPRARQAAEQAVALGPGSATALSARGHIHVQVDHRYREGMDLYRRALRINPDLAIAHQWLAISTAHTGDAAAALAHMRRAQALEPRTIAYGANVGLLLYFARDYDAATTQLQGLLELEPGLDQARSVLGNIWIVRGAPDRALRLFQAKSTPGPGGLGDLGRAYASLGDRDGVQEEIAQLQALGRAGYGVSYDLATIHALQGQHESACASLRAALADQSQMIGFMRLDPHLDGLRGLPCYLDVERQLYGVAPIVR